LGNVAKKCPNCGAGIELEETQEIAVCCYCDSKVYVKQTPPESDTFSPYMYPYMYPAYSAYPAYPGKRRKSGLGRALLITFACLGVFVAIGIAILIYIEENQYTLFGGNPAHGYERRGMDDKETLTFSPGEMFIFDEFEVVIGDTYDWRVVDYDERSTINGLDVIRVPITFTNISDETRRFDRHRIKVYGVEGISVHFSGLSVHFYDDGNIDSAGSLRSGATVDDKYIHFFYDGDGYYHISFETWNKAWEVGMYIEK